MKTLLQINTIGNSGSTGRIVEEIGQFAIDNGWKSYIAFARNAKKSASELIKIGNKIDILWHVLQTRLFDKHGFASNRATKRLIKEIIEIKPDVIHLHNLHGYFLNVEILFNFLASTNIPIIWTLHDCWTFTGHCTHFAYVGCDKWKTQCLKCPQKKEYPASKFIDNSFENFKTKKKLFNSLKELQIVTVSKWLEEIVKQSYLQVYNISTVNNGVDINIFCPKEETQKFKSKYNLDDKFILLAVASAWIERKGLNELVKLSEFLEDDEILIMVGQIRDNIKLPLNIINIKKIEDLNELSEIYAAANVIMNLSYQETFGMTTVEGFACGTPSIVYNCTASPELITFNTGYVVSPGDFIGIRKALDKIKLNKPEFYSVNCRKRAVDFYNKNDRYNEYFSIYENIMKK